MSLRWISSIISILSLLSLAGTVASAQSFDGTWRGDMTCAKLSFTKGPQRVPIELVISGGAATFARKVWNQDRSAIVGTEEGSGTVAATGAVTLSAVWKSAVTGRYTFTASYEGRLAARSGQLNGRQVWMVDAKSENRNCSIALKKAS